jgi:hypothetical protein
VAAAFKSVQDYVRNHLDPLPNPPHKGEGDADRSQHGEGEADRSQQGEGEADRSQQGEGGSR